VTELQELVTVLGVAGLAAIALLIATAYFNRDPDRAVQSISDSIVSAADGTVSSVESLTFNELCKQAGIADLEESIVRSCWSAFPTFWSISVFMSVLDVHVNRASVRGKVISTVRKQGTFLPFFPTDDPRRNERQTNERNTILMGNEQMTIAIVQMVGHLARKIECWVRPGDVIEQGARIGRIRLGSQVTVVFPALRDQAIAVQPGSLVKAGLSVLASKSRSLESGPRLALIQRRDSFKEKLLTGFLGTVLNGYLKVKLGLLLIAQRMASRRRSGGRARG
jgi:phosphatidylserine decarboxylase